MAILRSTDPAADLRPGAAQVATLGLIPADVAGVRATLAVMADLVRAYRINPIIRAHAESIIFFVPEKNARAEIISVFEWVRDNVRYTQDVNGVETIKTPDAALESLQGDCDDQATLTAALLESIGYACRLVAVCGDRPGEYSHVFSEVDLGGYWFALETTEDWPFGKRAPSQCAPMFQAI